MKRKYPKHTHLETKNGQVTYFSHICGRFDSENGVIHGVSVITEGNAKGHNLVIDSQTLMEIKDAAEGLPNGRLKCKLNHKSGVDAVFGYLSDFRVEGPKLLGDLHLLRRHKDYHQTWEQLETLPNEIGLSVAFVPPAPAKGSGKARCEEVLSADLVPEPAANPTGLFEAKVDNEINLMDTATDTQTQTQGEPTLGDILSFMQKQQEFFQTDLLPRIEKIEQFQEAVQAELDQAEVDPDADPENPAGEGDDGNQAGTAHQVSNANGGTDMNNGHNPFAASVGAPTGISPAMAAELSSMRDTIMLMRREQAKAKEDSEREAFESAIDTLQNKQKAIVEFASKLELENETLKKALATGTNPVKNNSVIFFERGGDALTANAGRFEQLCAKYEAQGKKKTEAVMLARKEDPSAHQEYLSRAGVKFDRTVRL